MDLHSQVYWTAPPRDSGCIVLKATVIESRENWFSEDGRLTRKLCEESADQNVQPERLERCTACSEAKYEVSIIYLYVKPHWSTCYLLFLSFRINRHPICI
nr:unnamed protein product [Callosobruchus analis]